MFSEFMRIKIMLQFYTAIKYSCKLAQIYFTKEHYL